jgi:hypothetical protein
LKLGVLNPAGASVAEFAATLTSPVPNAIDVAKRQAQRRILLRWGMSMVVPPKEHGSRHRREDNKPTDPLTSNTESCELAIENYRLEPEVLYSYKLVRTTVIPTSRGNLMARR